MHKLFIISAAISGFFTVALGAFGAHALKKILEEYQKVDVFETAVKYQMFHTIALLVVGMLLQKSGPDKWLVYSGFSFIVGTLIFSGSLYLLASFNIPKLGMITPIGGLFLLLGWLMMLLHALKI